MKDDCTTSKLLCCPLIIGDFYDLREPGCKAWLLYIGNNQWLQDKECYFICVKRNASEGHHSLSSKYSRQPLSLAVKQKLFPWHTLQAVKQTMNVKPDLHISSKDRKHMVANTSFKLSRILWVSHSFKDRRDSYLTRNISYWCADSLQILFGALLEACSVIGTTIWRPILMEQNLFHKNLQF